MSSGFDPSLSLRSRRVSLTFLSVSSSESTEPPKEPSVSHGATDLSSMLSTRGNTTITFETSVDDPSLLFSSSLDLDDHDPVSLLLPLAHLQPMPHLLSRTSHVQSPLLSLSPLYLSLVVYSTSCTVSLSRSFSSFLTTFLLLGTYARFPSSLSLLFLSLASLRTLYYLTLATIPSCSRLTDDSVVDCSRRERERERAGPGELWI